VLAVVACRQLVGIGEQPPGPGGVDAGAEAQTPASQVVLLTMGLRTAAFIDELGSSAGLDLDPSLGIILAYPYDCLSNAAPGVSFQASGAGPRAESFYYASGTPTQQGTLTSLPLPAGGFANVEPGAITLVASVHGAPVSSTLVLTRGNTLTELPNMVPTP
jgi:hypothetical protein